MDLQVKRLSLTAKLPTKAHWNDAGWDLYADEHIGIKQGNATLVKTGIAVKIPDGYFGLIRDRSSMAKKGIVVIGGVIDCQYTGEIIVCLQDLYRTDLILSKGDKIAQMLILPVPNLQVVEVDELPDSERGQKGFGSSGK